MGIFRRFGPLPRVRNRNRARNHNRSTAPAFALLPFATLSAPLRRPYLGLRFTTPAQEARTSRLWEMNGWEVKGLGATGSLDPQTGQRPVPIPAQSVAQ